MQTTIKKYTNCFTLKQDGINIIVKGNVKIVGDPLGKFFDVVVLGEQPKIFSQRLDLAGAYRVSVDASIGDSLLLDPGTGAVDVTATGLAAILINLATNIL